MRRGAASRRLVIWPTANYHQAGQHNDGYGQLRMDPGEEIDSIDAAREILRRRGWLKDMPPVLREKLLARCRLLPPFERGQYLLRFGDKPDGIYGIVSGGFSFQIAPHEQGPQTVHLYRSGAWVGELAYILDTTRATWIMATRRGCAVCLPRSDLQALTAAEPELWRWIALCLAHNTRIAISAIDDMTIRSPRRRLAAILLRLAGLRPDPEQEHASSLELDLTQADLASLSNMSRTVVGENLGQLEDHGFLECGYGVIRLIDPAGLSAWLRDMT
jgi:CRP-like cAMP-binding protein